ncbi:N-acetylmuramoyl-L-alanine amidase [Methylobacterium sp. E-065]|uniref:peptidoglycan recognition protein family protein n=1 Tax=Methylobacterium sp. E-065 TaxID=2836583 RepID=UPI001FB99E32|nr:N-acetylmuramoyl-L-alanine amidase [Methylobacterium sp. E-065]MCJ2019587.1 N-acetylmuramoyl-L-alanine amidase [Methylobacterium sp. E-065]
MMPFLSWLADVPRAAGLKVAEQPGWKTRGHGPMGEVKGIICHHTASNRNKGNAPSIGIVTEGRGPAPGAPALTGPLSAYVLGRDGTVYVIGAGVSHHAGSGQYRGITAGNSSMIGIEAENDGIGEPWLAVQREAYVRLCAAILDRAKLPTIMCCGHKEWTTRKIDPAGIDMVVFRRDIDAVRNGGIVRPLIPKQDAQKRPTLRRGASGPDVIALQNAIGVKADGQFGPGTESTLRAYQRAHHLVADGICGPACWAAIDSVRAAA